MRWSLIGVAMLGAVLLGAGTQPAAPGRFTIGKDTTRVSGPLRADGTVDYPAAAAEYRRRGVTAANNAAGLILQAVGRGKGEDRISDEAVREAGLEPKEIEEGAFVSLQTYANTQLKGPERAQLLKDFERLPLAEPVPSTKMPEVAKWVAANAKAFGLLEAASRKERYVVAPPAGIRWVYPPLRSVLAGAEVGLRTRMCLRLGDEDPAGAAADLETLLGLATMTARNGDVLSLAMAAGTQTRWSLEAAWLARRPGKALLRSHLKVLRETPEIRLAPEALDVYERFGTLEDVMGLARGDYREVLGRWSGMNLEAMFRDLPTPTVFDLGDLKQADLDGVMKAVNAEYDAWTDGVREADPKRREERLAKLEAATTDRFPGNLIGEMIGQTLQDAADGKLKDGNDAETWEAHKARLIASVAEFVRRGKGESAEAYARRLGLWAARSRMSASALRSSWAQLDHYAAKRRVNLAAVAVATYRAERGNWPGTLAALKGEYLDEVPVDPYTGKALVYRVEGGEAVVYSVGPDGKDDGGKGYDWRSKTGDVVVRVGK